MKHFFAVLRAQGRLGLLASLAAALIAIGYGWPIAMRAYAQLAELNVHARVRLIEQHRLWELQPDFRGKPEAWTRMASHLLSDGQLLRRVAVKYGAAAEQIELDYRRDLAIARAEVVVSWLVIWAGPLAALYGLAVLLAHRRHSPPPPLQRPPPASLSDPRYRPPERP
jgi:hypothetical protein